MATSSLDALPREAEADLRSLVVIGTQPVTWLSRFASPAGGVRAWLTLAAWTGTGVRGAAVSGCLNDEGVAVDRIDRGALVPASCRLTLR